MISIAKYIGKMENNTERENKLKANAAAAENNNKDPNFSSSQPSINLEQKLEESFQQLEELSSISASQWKKETEKLN